MILKLNHLFIYLILHFINFANTFENNVQSNNFKSCAEHENGKSCKNAKIFIGLIDQLSNHDESIQYKNKNPQVLRTEEIQNLVSRFINDCHLWNFQHINVTFADEQGIWFSSKNFEEINETIFSNNFIAPRTRSRNNTSSLQSAFVNFFSLSTDTLNLAYFITDNAIDWHLSKFFTYLAQNQAYIANFINSNSIYTKLMIFGLHKVVRDANMELVELHQLAHYYFEEVWFMESDILDLQSVDRRSYSLCSELPNNYEYPCVKKDKKNSPNCRTLSLIVILGLDESKTTYRDLEETKEFLRKISQTCNPSQTKLSIFMLGATGTHISCQAGSEECEKAISGLTLEAATYKVGGLGYYGSRDRTYSAILQRMALKNGFKILKTVREGLKSYDISTWIVITNFACDGDDRLYQLIQKETNKSNIVENRIQRKDYEFLTMFKQHHILFRAIMINQPSSSQSCLSDSPLEIAQEYVKAYELIENSNITLNNLIDDDHFKICTINQLDLPTNNQSKVLSLDTLVIILVCVFLIVLAMITRKKILTFMKNWKQNLSSQNYSVLKK